MRERLWWVSFAGKNAALTRVTDEYLHFQTKKKKKNVGVGGWWIGFEDYSGVCEEASCEECCPHIIFYLIGVLFFFHISVWYTLHNRADNIPYYSTTASRVPHRDQDLIISRLKRSRMFLMYKNKNTPKTK